MRVKIAVEVDDHFVRMLNATVNLKGLAADEPPRQMTAMEVLGLLALGEMRGATAEQIHAKTPIEWRPHIEVLHAERRVTK